MQITIDTDTASQAELNALMALFASLGGRNPPAAEPDGAISVTEPAAVGRGGSAPIVTADVSAHISPLASDELIAQAAAARTVPPPPPTAAGSADGDSKPTLATLDASGVPWDARIHSSSQSINKSDGMWRVKRGMDEVEFGRIHAELQDAHAGELSGDEPTGADGPAGNSSSTDVPAPPPPPEPVAVPNAPTAAGQTSAESAPGDGSRWPTWADFVPAVSALGLGVANYENLNATAALFGVAKFSELKDHPDRWADFYEALGGK